MERLLTPTIRYLTCPALKADNSSLPTTTMRILGSPLLSIHTNESQLLI